MQKWCGERLCRATATAHPRTEGGSHAADEKTNVDRKENCRPPGEREVGEKVRQLLENILKRQVEICGVQRKVTLRESLTGPSSWERVNRATPPNARLVQRMQEPEGSPVDY